MSEVSTSDFPKPDPIEVSIQKAFENEHIKRFLHMSVFNFSQGLPETAKAPLREILKTFMESAAKLALASKIPEPDMSLPNWKDGFANSLENGLLNGQAFTNLVEQTKTEIKNKFPSIDNPMAFTDFPYMQMANNISQVAYMHSYNIDPKYIFLTPEEMAKETKHRINTARKAGKKVEFEQADDNGGETIQ